MRASNDTALVVAIAAATISLVSLVWQLVLFYLSGARLAVRLFPAALTIHGHVLTGPERGWRHAPESLRRTLDDGFVDLALIRVVNVGRAPVSVSQIALDFGHEGWRFWSRHTISGQPVPAGSGATSTEVVRLDVGEACDVYVDHIPLVEHVRATRPHARALRASAWPAGRRRRRSPWRRRWHIAKGRPLGWPHPTAATDLEAFREVFRVVYPRDVKKLYGSWVALGALRLRNPHPSAAEIRDALEEELEVSDVAMDLVKASIAIEHLFQHSNDPHVSQREPPRDA